MFAEINGANLYYETFGSSSNPSIMVLHGGPGVSDHTKSKKAYEPLSDDYHVVVYDHRGCGRSEYVEPVSNAQYAKDAEGLREELGLGEIVMIGGSYGGYITQEYAIRFPENLRGFILRDTAPSSEHKVDADKNAKAGIPDLQEADVDAPDITIADYEKVMAGDVESDEELKRIFHGMLPLYFPSFEEYDPEDAEEALNERHFHHRTHNKMFSDEHPNMDYTNDLPDVDVPALVTVGRHDFITPPSASEEIADLLPDSRLHIFEDSGHSPNLEQQDEFLSLVREFLDEVGHN